MKKTSLWTIIVLFIFAQSCITQKKCEARYPTKDSVSVVYKDSLVFIGDTLFFPGDSTVIHDTLPCPDYHKEVSTGKIKASVTIKDGKLTVKCHEDSLRKELAYWKSIKTKSTFESKKSKPEVIIENDWWAKYALGATILFLLENIVLLGVRLAKKKFGG